MHLCQLEIITINFLAFYMMKNGTLLCDATMTLMRLEKIGNIFFLKQHICFLKKMNINHFYPKMHTAAQISTKRHALMVELNYNVKIDAIRKLFDNWSKRILTPLGKILVIKSLALSQLNCLLASLPNPGEIIMKRLNNMFYNFLWSGKPDKIKRILLTQDYNNGGLRMVDLENFIYSMKMT